MAKYLLQEMNDVRNTGKRTVYPKMVTDQTLTTREFIDDKPTEIQEEGDRMLYRRVGVKDINFKTAPEMMRSLQMRTKFERVMTGARLLKKNLYTLEQRIENALAIIDEKGHITLGEYAKVNNLSRTTASKELAKISSDPNMPIDYTGQASHKIWIRRKRVNY